MSETTDIAVIGAGPGGYAAAFLAADHGFSVTLIDPEAHPGGVCLHRGCIPSKALLHASRLLEEAREGAHMGIRFGEPVIDLARLRSWKGEVVQRLTGGLGDQSRRRGITYIQGRAHFLDSRRLEVQPTGGDAPRQLGFRHAILATGSRPAGIPGLAADLPGVMDSTAALALETIPKSLLVVGGGNIGLELGTVYASLGSRVSVVEMTAGLLPGADRDLVRPLAKRLAGRLAAIHLKTRVITLEPGDDGLQVTLAGENGRSRTETFEKILIATGRLPNSESLGLERTRVRLDRGLVRVDAAMKSDDPNILAIGDLIGGPMLAHKAAYEARIAVATLADVSPPPADPVIPAVTYTDPELAWAGLTESAARHRKVPVRAARFPWGASGRAHTLERTEGITKLVLDPDSERILGMGVVGAGAGELIAAGVQAINNGLTARQLSEIIHPHPTLSETVMESAEVFLGHCVHFHAPKRRR